MVISAQLPPLVVALGPSKRKPSRRSQRVVSQTVRDAFLGIDGSVGAFTLTVLGARARTRRRHSPGCDARSGDAFEAQGEDLRSSKTFVEEVLSSFQASKIEILLGFFCDARIVAVAVAVAVGEGEGFAISKNVINEILLRR